jgi:hypothetical protein
MTAKRSGKVLEQAVGWAKLEANLHNHLSGEQFPLSNPVKPNPKTTAFSTLCTHRHCLFLQYDGVREKEREELEPNFRPTRSSVLRVIKALKLLKMKEERRGTWQSAVLPPTVLLMPRTAVKIFIYRLLKKEKVRIRTTRRPESLPEPRILDLSKAAIPTSLFS